MDERKITDDVIQGYETVDETILWTGKKRPIFGKPISFTRYTLYTDRIVVNTGFLHLRQEEVRLYRVLDVNLSQNLIQRIFGIGTVRISSSDSTTPRLSLIHIKNPKEVMRLVSDAAEAERERKGIGMMEGLGIW